jgi:hypothetical protein
MEHAHPPFSSQGEAFNFLSTIFSRGTNIDSVPVPSEAEMEYMLAARSCLENALSSYQNDERYYVDFLLRGVQYLHERYVLTMKGIL